MATTTNKGQDLDKELEKKRLVIMMAFCEELTPLVAQINSLLERYEIDNVKEAIAFEIRDNKVEPYVFYNWFPCSLAESKIDK